MLTYDEVVDFVGGFLEESAPPPQLQLLNPAIAFSVALDAAGRAVSAALGYPVAGESAYDRVTKDYDFGALGGDRDSAAFALGAFTADVAPICTLGLGLASAGLKAAYKGGKRAVQSQLKKRAERIAREEAEERAKRKAEKAAADARAAKLKYYNEQIRGEVVKGGRVKESPGHIKPKVGG
jgi:hypothetical protein